jgi:hypothetical protein
MPEMKMGTSQAQEQSSRQSAKGKTAASAAIIQESRFFGLYFSVLRFAFCLLTCSSKL